MNLVVTTIAIPNWQDRVSPVFDVAENVLLVDVDGGTEQARRDLTLQVGDGQRRVAQLVQAGTNVLICGAISRPLEMAVLAAGIELIGQTCGEVEEVVSAFIDGRLRQGAFLMPGCRGRRCFRGQDRGQCCRGGWKGGDDYA